MSRETLDKASTVSNAASGMLVAASRDLLDTASAFGLAGRYHDAARTMRHAAKLLDWAELLHRSSCECALASVGRNGPVVMP